MGMFSRATFAFALGPVLLFGAAIQPARADTIFSDGTFNNADWNNTKIFDTAGNASFSAVQVASGGNPGSFQQTIQSLNQGWIGVGHLNNTFAYNPSVQGPITSIDFQYDLAEFSPLNGFEVIYQPLLFQDGTYFVASGDNLSEAVWTTFTHSGLTASGFGNTGDIYTPPGLGPANPNFSSTGGLIEFGFFSGNSPVGGPFTTNSGIDNLAITIHPVPATVPEPSYLSLLAITLAGLVASQRNRQRARGHG
jgi:hypothetical protein